MRRRYLPGWCVLFLMLWAWPALAMADDADALEEGEVEEVSTEEEADEGDEAPAAAEDDGTQEPADGDEPAEDGDAQDAADGDEPAEEASDDQVVDDEDAAAEDVVEGPGGAPLRTDYPGTEESLQARMDTGRIAGQEISPDDDPDEVYDLRVRELETQIDDLKERVFRSKSRIALLRESVLAENLAGSRAIVSYVNELGSRYKVKRAIFSVDGSQVFSTVDPNGELDGEVEIFSGPMTPGTHTVSVTLGLTGSGYGIFSYAKGYQFDLRFSCQFTAEEGRTTLVTVRSYKSGNAFTAHEERPDGICQISMVQLDIEDFEDEFEGEELPEFD